MTDSVAPRRRSTDRSAGPPYTVLLVDDSRAIRTILGRMLRDGGYEVIEAEDGRSGLQKFAETRPDLVLLDVDMPVMDGMQMLAELRQLPSHSDTPVLFLTARTKAADAAQGLALGANDYVRKPCEPEELLARVSTVLRLRSQELELAARAQAAEQVSVRDPLTGLGNRRGLAEYLDDLRMRHAPDASIGVALCDLDKFKSVNDTYGHHVGDVVLRAVAGRLEAAAGEAARIVRWGGEEFLAVVPPPCNTALANEVAERLCEAIRSQPVSTGIDKTLEITISVGCAIGELGAFDAVTEVADAALYEAKESGRDRAIYR